jgi:hypothetical protein
MPSVGRSPVATPAFAEPWEEPDADGDAPAEGVDTHVGAIGGAPPPGGMSAARLGVGAAVGCAALAGRATSAVTAEAATADVAAVRGAAACDGAD